MVFDIIMTDGGQSDYNHCIDYVFYNLENAYAARSLARDLETTIEELKTNALSHNLCEDVKLRDRGYRRTHLRKHSYKIYYTVNGNKVYIHAILHDKQDVLKWLP